MTKCEAIEILYGLVADVNAEEIADHIKTESLQGWSDTWRCRAKEMLMVLEDEPSNSEKPNNCEPKICDTCRFDDKYDDESICKECSRHYSDCYAPKTEPTISKMEQVDKDINVRSKDEPYIDIETGILHWCGWKYRRIYEDEPLTGEIMTEEEFDSMLARVLTGNIEPQTERSE